MSITSPPDQTHPIGPPEDVVWPAAPMPFQAQLLTEWCWAASVVMAAHNKHPSLTQCEVAHGLLEAPCCDGGGADPCPGMKQVRGPANVKCNLPANNEEIQSLLKKHAGNASDYKQSIVDEAALKAELAATPRRPVVMGCRVNQATRHAVVVVDQHNGIYRVYDPCIGDGIDATYEALKTYGKGLSGGKWTHTGASIRDKS